jgi:transcriptional regulator with XRE-family HTH domain
MNFDSEKMASAMRAGRNVLGWSQKEFASQSGVSMPTIARLESGGNCIFKTATELFATLNRSGVSFDWHEDGFEMCYRPLAANKFSQGIDTA